MNSEVGTRDSEIGISELEKLISVIGGDISSLFSINWKLLVEQFDNLDEEEKRHLWVDLGKAVMEILIKVNETGIKTAAIKIASMIRFR